MGDDILKEDNMKKNHIKKSICLAMVMILAFSTLVGCGSKDTPAAPSTSQPAAASSGAQTVE